MENYYSLLKCDENSSAEEIKKKYQELVLKYHPDKAILSDNINRDNFHSINKAWNVLKDPESRQKYDLELKRLSLSEQPPVFAYLGIKDLNEDKNSNLYSYPCRCGGVYTIPIDELLPPDCLVSCDECSFYILINVS